MNEEEKPTSVVDELSQPYGQQINQELYKWQIDTEDILMEIECNLRGIEWDENAGKFIQRGEELINAKGANMLKVILRPVISKVTTLSDLSEEDIDKEIIDTMNVVIDLLTVKWRDFNIERHNLSTIRIVIHNALFASLKKSKGGRWIDASKIIQKHVETYSDKSGGKKGLFSSLKI